MNAVSADGEGDIDMVVHDHEDAEFFAFSAEFFREERELFSGKIFFAELNSSDAAVSGRREDIENGASVREFVSDYEIEIGIAEAFRALFSEIGHKLSSGAKKRSRRKRLHSVERNCSAGLLDSAAADALHANFFAGNSTILVNDANALDVRFEGSRRDLHDVHTDTAFFLCQAPADDGGAGKLFLSANVTNVTHFTVS